MVVSSSCGSDEESLCGDGVQNAEEIGIDCGGPVCGACPSCDDGIQNGDEEGTDCGGANCEVCPSCDDGIQNGDETGIDCGGDSCDVCLFGAQGTWYSNKDDLPLTLSGLQGVDSAIVVFNLSNEYTLIHVFDDGTQKSMKGNYQQSESAVAGFWTINLQQFSPDTINFSGILMPKADPDELFYEVVEEDGINSAPTPEAGIGSSNEGDLGLANVQTYRRVN